MLSLIIPCAGRNFINNKPRWALKYSEEEIILGRCINTLGIENYNRIIVTILKDDLVYYSIDDLKKMISPKVEFCILNQETAGPADTIYETIVNMEISGEIQIKDIDILFDKPSINGNFISGIHLLNYDSDLKNVRNKSFITTNEKDVVMDIIEKNVKSDIISIGLYGFLNSSDFVKAYQVLKNSFDSDERIYVSHIITYLIGVENKVFNFVEIPKYELFESEKDYEKSIKNRGTFVVDTNRINIAEHVNEIKQIVSKNGKIILVVNDRNKELVDKIMRSNEIPCSFVIGSGTDYIRLIDNENDLKEIYLNAI